METFVQMINELSEKTIAFVGRTGVKVIEITPRNVTAKMPLKGNENHINIMYIGALCTLAEIPGGILASTCFDLEKYVPIVKDISPRFLRPARSDVTLEAAMSEDQIKRIDAVLAENGKVDFNLEGEFKDKAGEIVARSDVVFNLRTIHP